MSERHAITTEDLAKQHTTPEPRFSEEHEEPRTDEFPEQQIRDEDRVGEHETVESGFEQQPTEDEDRTVYEQAADEERTDVEPEPTAVASDQPTAQTTDAQRTQLFASDEAERFRDNWRNVQGDFVDDPQRAVRQADELVAEVMQTLASNFADHKRTLEEQWSKGGEAQTEDLRVALVQYRTFFQQLLSI